MMLLRADLISDRDQSNIVVKIGNRHVTLSAHDIESARIPSVELVDEAPERGASLIPPEVAPPSPEPGVGDHGSVL